MLSHDDDIDALMKAWSWDHPRDVVKSDLHMETGNTLSKGKDKNLPDEEFTVVCGSVQV